MSLVPNPVQTPNTEANTLLRKAGTDAGVEIGCRLMGRYEIRRVLGNGAFGQVLEVRDIKTGTDYALKHVPPELVRDEAQMAGIKANFVLVSQLSHQHIVTMRTLEVDDATGHVFVIMDLVRGIDLAKWIAQRRIASGNPNAPLPVDLAVGIAEQIAAALDYAHSQPISRGSDGRPKQYGILHRDLKPANVMVEIGREYRPGIPYVKLVDFGLAAEIQASLQSVSVAGQNRTVGTPVYMAPEQWEGRTLTRGVDQWALAVLIYEMIAGRRPFDGPTETAVMTLIREANPEQPETITAAQWEALKKTFQTDRRKRHQSSLTLINALAAAGPRTRNSIIAHPIPMPEEFRATDSAGASTRAAAPSKLPWKAIAAAFVILTLGGGGFGYMRWAGEKNREELQKILRSAEPARESVGEQLAHAIATLEKLIARCKEQAPDMAGAAAALQRELSGRSDALIKRAQLFETQLADAQRALLSNPHQALATLDIAESTGRADSSRHFPDLLAALKPDLKTRKADATVAASKFDFTTNFTAGKKASDNGDWAGAEKTLTHALELLGSVEHPLKAEASHLIANARAEQKKRADFEAKRKEADQHLAGGRFADAKSAYAAARGIWPESPDRNALTEGTAAAARGEFQKAYEAADAAAKSGDWAGAEKSAVTALTVLGDVEHPGKPSAEALIQRARAEQKRRADFNQKYQEAAELIAQKRFAEAIAAYQAAKQNLPDAPEVSRINDAIAHASRQVRYQKLMDDGHSAFARKQLEEARTAFDAALVEIPSDNAAVQARSRVDVAIAERDANARIEAERKKTEEVRLKAEQAERDRQAQEAARQEALRLKAIADAQPKFEKTRVSITYSLKGSALFPATGFKGKVQRGAYGSFNVYIDGQLLQKYAAQAMVFDVPKGKHTIRIAAGDLFAGPVAAEFSGEFGKEAQMSLTTEDFTLK